MTGIAIGICMVLAALAISEAVDQISRRNADRRIRQEATSNRERTAAAARARAVAERRRHNQISRHPSAHVPPRLPPGGER